MRFLRFIIGIAALVGRASAKGTSDRFCDPLTTICYSSYTTSNNISYRIALPEVSTAPFDAILQIVSPVSNGWAGFSWGGQMAYVPLTVGWPNGTRNSVYSSRFALGLSLPDPYDKAEYNYMKGSGVNSTHWTLTVLCKGCSQWQSVDGSNVTISPKNTSQPFANAWATTKVVDPANNASAFNVHTGFDHWTLDLASARSSSFNQWVSSNVIAPQPPPVTSSTLSPSSTPPRSTSSFTTNGTIAAPTPTTSIMPNSCAGVNAPAFSGLTVSGWKATKVQGSLTNPRGVVFDSAGNLLVVQNGKGITAFAIGPDGCIAASKIVLKQMNLNHGIAVSHDGKTLFASSATNVWSWTYDPKTMSVSGDKKVLISGMLAGGHTTRSIAIPPEHPNLLVVQHGSSDNNDYAAGNVHTGRSALKVFNLTTVPDKGYVYASEGYQMGYGIRNAVGLTFDGNGMLWVVENGLDEMQRETNNTLVDIHFDNPADELNYLGDPSIPNNNWYGYPTCHTVWKPDGIPDRLVTVGQQIVVAPNNTFNDASCKNASVPARLAIPAHSAPLDSQFSPDFKSLYVTYHGSWDRSPPLGFKLVQIPFAKEAHGGYNPTTSLVASNSSSTDVWWNADLSKCSTTVCFRPVSIAVDRFGRLYITSDSSGEGELWLLGKV